MKRIKNKRVLIVSCLVIVGLIVGLIFWNNDRDNKNVNPEGENNAAIEAEKKSAEEFDKQLQESGNNTGSNESVSNPDLKVANVILVSANSEEVRGFISNVIEDNGKCTATATKGSSKLTATSTAFIDVNKTVCAPITLPTLSEGDWTITLDYLSSSAAGTSESMMVKAP